MTDRRSPAAPRATRRATRFVACLAAAAALAGVAPDASAQSLSFTYQGELREAGELISGVYDFQFTFYSQPTGGVPVSSSYCADDITVTDGRFFVELPLVIPPTSTGVYLNLSVREGAIGDCSSGASYEILSPRQALTRAPNATYAAAIGNVAPAITGAMRYNSSQSRIEFFDGTYWHAISTVDSANLIEPTNDIGYAFPGSYPFVVPAGVTSLFVQINGGGGGGGGLGSGSTTMPGFCTTGTGSYAAGGGGGAAGASAAYLIDVTPGETLTIIVGQGGAGGTTSGGSTGQPSRIRRGVTDIVSVPGGNGGSRTGTPVAMASDPSPNACQGILGGSGAPLPPAPTFTGPGRLLATYSTGAGAFGRGPACTGGLSPTFCNARGGQGGYSSLTLFNNPGAGEGGDGAGATINAENGSSGRVTIWWY